MPRPRLLFVTSRFPHPPIGGDRLRAFHLARLCARAFDVDVIGLGAASAADVQAFVAETGVRSAQTIPHPRWRALVGAARALIGGLPLQVGYFQSAALDAAVAERIAEADVLLCHLVRSSGAWRRQRPIAAVLDLCDAISNNYAQVVQSASLLNPWTWISRVEGPRLRAFEQSELSRFDLYMLVSAADARSIDAPAERTLLVTQGVDLVRLAYRPPAQRQGRALALIGKMDTYPNRTGAMWFAREVLPLLGPGTRLKLVGECPPRLRRQFERLPGVEVTGHVDDIAAACADCRAAVAPLDVATGIQNKVLEYFALGLPAVLSPSAARGLLPQSRGTYLEATTPAQWVQALDRLEGDRAATETMTLNARRYVEEHHRWDQIGAELVDRIRPLLEAAPRHARGEA